MYIYKTNNIFLLSILLHLNSIYKKTHMCNFENFTIRFIKKLKQIGDSKLILLIGRFLKLNFCHKQAFDLIYNNIFKFYFYY